MASIPFAMLEFPSSRWQEGHSEIYLKDKDDFETNVKG